MTYTEPGWYHGQGDPPGTVRWWDGEAWASDYVVQPGAGAAGAGHRQYATWLDRVGAVIIDGLVSIAMFIPAVIVVLVLAAVNETLGVIVAILLYIAVIALTVYLNWWLQGTNGQSPGKRIMGIETIDDHTGQYIGGGKGLGRGFLAFINSLPFYLGWLWPLWDDKSQTFVDKILSTVVVKTDRPRGLFPLFPDGKPF